jgi:hypothetical protein
VEWRYFYVVEGPKWWCGWGPNGGAFGGHMVVWCYYYTVTVSFLVDDENDGGLGTAPYDFYNFE